MGMDGGAARMHETAKPSAQTVLRPCPCCGGEAGYREHKVKGEIPHTVGRIICLDCGLQTLSVPVDGTYGVAFEIEDFARMWNLRTGDGKVGVLGEYRADQ